MKGSHSWALTLAFSLLGTGWTAAASLDAIRATNDQDHTRVVLSMTDRSPSWDIQYKAEKDTLLLTLPDTQNHLVGPVIYESRREGLLRGVTLQESKKGLVLNIMANQPVQHNVFALEDPDRIVVDLFTNYSQRTVKTLTPTITYLRWDRSYVAGRVQMYIAIHTGAGGASMHKTESTVGTAVKQWKGTVALPIAGIPNSAFTEYTEKAYLLPTSKGYALTFQEPKYEVLIGNKAYPITGMNKERTTNSLILYTPSYGLRTGTNSYGEELIIKQGIVQSHGAGNATLVPGEVVLSGHGTMESLLRAVKNGTKIVIRQKPMILPDWAKVATPVVGVPVLKQGQYVGPKRADGEGGRMSRAFLGTTAEGYLVFVTIKGGEGSSVGVTLKEGADLLKEVGLQSVVAVGAGQGANLYIQGKPVIENGNTRMTASEIALMK